MAGAAAATTRAVRALSAAREELARAAQPGDPHCMLHPDWCWAGELLAARRDKLLAYPGAIAVGLAERLRDGEPTGQPCVTVFVVDKRTPEELAAAGARPIQKSVWMGERHLPVDVVELGTLDRQADAGDSLGPATSTAEGTLGAFAVDRGTGSTVAITAMHVTGLYEYPAPGLPELELTAPSLQVDAAAPAFARLLRGTRTGTDAAKLALLAPRPPITVLPGTIGRVRGWRPLTYPGDQGTIVRLYGTVSKEQSGYVVSPSASIPSESLDAAILVQVVSAPGDSGGALVDSDGWLLGFLVGQGSSQLHGLRVFTPASLVLDRLGCDIPATAGAP